jgi:hypothetical protein
VPDLGRNVLHRPGDEGRDRVLAGDIDSAPHVPVVVEGLFGLARGHDRPHAIHAAGEGASPGEVLPPGGEPLVGAGHPARPAHRRPEVFADVARHLAVPRDAEQVRKLGLLTAGVGGAPLANALHWDVLGGAGPLTHQAKSPVHRREGVLARLRQQDHVADLVANVVARGQEGGLLPRPVALAETPPDRPALSPDPARCLSGVLEGLGNITRDVGRALDLPAHVIGQGHPAPQLVLGDVGEPAAEAPRRRAGQLHFRQRPVVGRRAHHGQLGQVLNRDEASVLGLLDRGECPPLGEAGGVGVAVGPPLEARQRSDGALCVLGVVGVENVLTP